MTSYVRYAYIIPHSMRNTVRISYRIICARYITYCIQSCAYMVQNSVSKPGVWTRCDMACSTTLRISCIFRVVYRTQFVTHIMSHSIHIWFRMLYKTVYANHAKHPFMCTSCRIVFRTICYMTYAIHCVYHVTCCCTCCAVSRAGYDATYVALYMIYIWYMQHVTHAACKWCRTAFHAVYESFLLKTTDKPLFSDNRPDFLNRAGPFKAVPRHLVVFLNSLASLV